MNDEKRNEISNKLMNAARCVSKDNIGCILNDALHGEKKLSGINENCSVCCSISLAELANLIKPSCHECVPDECPLNVRHDNDRIDRDALLALADEMTVEKGDIWGWSSRIREALGDGVKLD